MPDASVIGWDIGGAHVKAALLRHGQVHDVAQWPCPLWQGTDHLERAIEGARLRWPVLPNSAHAVTMTGEMVDLFADRADGVRRIAALLGTALPAPRFFAGDAGWCDADAAAAQWPHIASANWLATARHAALALDGGEGVLVDIGSTTTDLIAFRRGAVLTRSHGDAQRLARGELVYHGVVRTPLCALAPRIAWHGEDLNVMNEFFATTADVYRLTGELDAAHDQQASADNTAKDVPHTQARLARMIGLDARDGSDADWLAFARAWRSHQVAELRGQLARVIAAHGFGAEASIVSAGCGDFLAAELVPAGWRCVAYGNAVAHVAPQAPAGTAAWAQVCAPSVAVAALFTRDQR